MTTTEMQLPKVAQTRISRLALASGRSPPAMLHYVLCEGFDAVELSIKENARADEQLSPVPRCRTHDVMRDALSAARQAKHDASMLTKLVRWNSYVS